MLTKRIIPCLDIQEGQTVKGVNFINIRNAGDPVFLGKTYSEQGADELIFLDITATIENRSTFAALVSRIAENINIPFTVGGGIRTEKDIRRLLDAGADKVTINSSAVRDPEIINKVAGEYGSQCIVLAIDAKKEEKRWRVYIDGGRTPTGRVCLEWAKEAFERGAGEIMFTSMNNDGTKKGFAIEMIRALSDQLPIPIIASGGAGNMEHFVEVFREGRADAALAASIFHFGEIGIADLKNYLFKNQIEVRR